jgi:hypothetical protein
MNTSPLKDLYTVQYSHYCERKGMFPYHYESLLQTTEKNCQFWEQPHGNVWTLLFVGSENDCIEFIDLLLKKRPAPARMTDV